jgi:hypothetical protein
MQATSKKQIGSGRGLPKKTAVPPPAGYVQSDDVERVLEHVSSPYRWELLEVPETPPKADVAKKSAHHRAVKHE